MSVIVPLFDAAAGADQWHRVAAPGGYEWWHVAAYDPTADILISAHVFEGFPFDATYRRRCAAYRCRPTHNRPPRPAEFPCARLTILQRDKVLLHNCRKSPIATDPVLHSAAGWSLNQFPQLSELVFQSHAEMLSASGTIALPSGHQSFQGIGRFDHRFSTVPLGSGRRMRLEILEPRRVLLAEDGSYAQCDANGTQNLPDEILSMGKLRRSGGSPGYPDVIRFGGHELARPVMLTRGREYVELAYRSTSAVAVAEVVEVS
ncbi:MAG TPA: hypothetical protein VL992_11795 [Tepidisphaeraceae bacterium]|nr:hypothetical protein [Tepidisphaeraceae bacterium]